MDQKENIKTCLGCAIWFIVAVLICRSCDWYSSYQKKKEHQAYIEEKRNDSIRKAFIADSLAHDPRYQDSIRKEELFLKKWLEEQSAIDKTTLIGFAIDGDSIYHYSMHDLYIDNNHCHSYGFSTSIREQIIFLTLEEVEELGLKLCNICKEMDDIYNKYTDNEIIPIEDAKDYDLIPIEEASEYCDHSY